MNGDCSLIKYALSASHLDIALFFETKLLFQYILIPYRIYPLNQL